MIMDYGEVSELDLYEGVKGYNVEAITTLLIDHLTDGECTRFHIQR